MKLTVKAPAKINLTLDVLHKRDDGYHEVEMVMTTIDLADRISLTKRGDSLIHIDSTVSFVPNDERNLAYKAAQLLKNRFGVHSGVSIHIDKNIPVAAGLAGGSSDAAATIRGLNEIWELNLTADEMATLGAEIGSDVSFCVYGGTALATGRGEIIERLPAPPPFWVVLAKPPIGVSTPHIYQQLNLKEIQHRPNTKQMIEAIEKRDFSLLSKSIGNVLEQVTLNEYPQVARLKAQMLKFGADAVLMSGSGPTVFAITQKESRAHRVYNGLRGFCQDTYLVHSLGERSIY